MIAAWLAKSVLMQSPIGAFLKRVPGRVWLLIALAVGAYLLGSYAVRKHQAAVYRTYKAGYDEGHRVALADVRRAQAQADAKAATINSNLRKINDETNRVIARAADDLRLHGPGKATCPGFPAPSSPASGHVAADRGADAPVATVPNPGGAVLIAVPFNDLILFAEQHDRLRSEALTWRESDRQQSQITAQPQE